MLRISRPFTCFIYFFVCLSLFNPVFAASAEHMALKQSTQELLAFAHELRLGNKISMAQQQKLLPLLQKRQALLVQEISNARAFKQLLPYLLPEKIVRLFPNSMQAYLEKEIKLTGVIEVRIADDFKNNKSKTLYLIKQNAAYYYLNFINMPPTHLQTGDKIKIAKAYLIAKDKESQQLLLSVDDLTVISKAHAVPAAFGPQKVIVMAANFQDKPGEKPWSLDVIKASVITKVSDMYYESSYNQTTVTGNVVGWYTIPVNSTDVCDANKIASFIDQAATNAGVDLTAYQRRVYLFPKNSCDFAGLGTVGMQGGYSKSWLNGTITVRTAGHELGHNLGLWHSQYLKCPAGSVEEGTCTSLEYQDNVDIMGGAQMGHFNAFQKDRLGWLNYQVSPPITTVTTSGNYVIDAYETKNNNSKALKVLKTVLPNGSKDYYYVEFRRGIGFDTELSTCGTYCDYTNGVVLHRGNDTAANSSYVLDMTPDGVTSKIALLPGKSFVSPNAANGGVTFTLNAISGNTALVNVTFGNTPPPPVVCQRVAQTMTITPTQTQWVTAGASASYTITIKNNDSATCPAANFYLTSSVPNDLLKTSLDPQWVSIAPGGAKTSTLIVASKTGITTGIYPIGVTASSTSTPGVHASVIANLGINP